MLQPWVTTPKTDISSFRAYVRIRSLALNLTLPNVRFVIGMEMGADVKLHVVCLIGKRCRQPIRVACKYAIAHKINGPHCTFPRIEIFNDVIGYFIHDVWVELMKEGFEIIIGLHKRLRILAAFISCVTE